jgi:ParB family chromosome partitioning protein
MAGRLGNTDTALGGRRPTPSARPLAAVRTPTAVPPPTTHLGDATASPPTATPARIPIAAIAPHPLNPRGRVTGGVDELAASIRELGVLEPVVAVTMQAFTTARPALAEQIPSGVNWVLIAGERRLAAAALAGLTEIPAMSGDHLIADGLDIEAMVVENIQRENLTPLQEARAFQTLTADGLSQRTIAKRVGRNQSHIARRLSLLRLPDDALTQIADGTLAISDALILASVEQGITEQAWALMRQHDIDAHRAVARAIGERDRERQHAEVVTSAREKAAAEGTPLLKHTAGQPSPTTEAYQLADDDTAGIAAARALGTLVAEATPDGLIYYDTSRNSYGDDPTAPTPEPFDWQTHEAQRREQERHRRSAAKARRTAAAALAGKPPTATGLTEYLVGYAITTASHDAIRLAVKLLGPDDDPHVWRRQLATATPTERRRAAWAIYLAHRDITAAAEHHRWGPDEVDYLELLATTGYQLTDDDRARLAAIGPGRTDDNPQETDR